MVIESANKVGKKILMSGGGRCNFTNYQVEADNFISGNPHFCKSALRQYTQWYFIAMVERHKIDFEERKHGQLFCIRSAKDILEMLLAECDSVGVVIKTKCTVTNVSATQEADASARYQLIAQGPDEALDVECRSLVVATGALSIPTLGGSGFGYELARQFGMPLTERRAGLVPFMFSDALKPICERLSGLALEVDLSCGAQDFHENILFTHRGISGPAALQISNYWHPGEELAINLLPGIDAESWLLQQKHEFGKSLLRNRLQLVLAKPLTRELQALWWKQEAETALAEFSDARLVEIGARLNRWLVKPSATEGYRTAEVTLGGVDTDSISSKTMESKTHSGMYFIGEVVDVSGHLGGFNFQWAWSSGYVAGMNC